MFTKLNFIADDSSNFNGKSYKCTINLNDSSLIFVNAFEVILNFKSALYTESEMNYIFRYKGANKILKEFSTLDNYSENFYDRISSSKFNFYKVQKKSDYCISFHQNSFLRFSLQNKPDAEDLRFDFWIKFLNSDLSFFRIINKENTDVILTLSDNIYQMLTVATSKDGLDIIQEQFLSKKNWYHFSIEILSNQSVINGYCNNNQIFSLPIKNYYSAQQFRYEFSNKTKSKVFQIDQINLWRLNKSYLIKNAETNKDSTFNYLNLNCDNINNSGEIISNGNIKLTLSDCESVKSDMPVLLKIPEINITLFDDFYSLEWSEEKSNAQKYILEKSFDGRNFFDLKEVDADKSKGEKYSYLDKINSNSEIIYYRLKQINMNDQVVYSPFVKIGQGNPEQFIVDQNFPNPFNPTTSFTVELYENTYLKIIVYNLVGKQISTLQDGYLSKGKYNFTFNGDAYPSGIYFYEVSTPLSSRIMKMILAK